MNMDNVYNSNSHIEDVSSENPELNRFMTLCSMKGIEFNPAYKDYSDDRGNAFVSLLFNSDSLPLIYAIVALLRREGYEFSFDKLNDKESAFNIADVLNTKDNTELFAKLNDVITNYDVAKNYYYELPPDLQKYFDICNYAHRDNDIRSTDDKLLQFSYVKKEEGHKYTIKTEDERYLQSADTSEFSLSVDDVSSYELVSDDHIELDDKLNKFENGVEKAEVVSEQEDIVVIDEKEEEEEEEEKPQEEKRENTIENPVAEEKIELDEETLMQDNGKFVDVSQKEDEPVMEESVPEEAPSIDMNEINRMIYEEPTIEEDHAMTL